MVTGSFGYYAEAPFNIQKKKERYKFMKEFWNVIQMVFTAVGGWLGYFLGGYDGLLYALVVFMVVDYITGVMCAVNVVNLRKFHFFKKNT